MSVAVCVAGATGWTGSAVARAVLDAADLSLVSAVSRSSAGRDLGRAWGGTDVGVPVFATVAQALETTADAGLVPDVLVDYTAPDAVLGHAVTALERGVSVVVGTSGLDADDLASLDALARRHGVGVFAGGNFSITATLMARAAHLAAQHVRDFEIVDYARADKPDAPSGTARELAERLGSARRRPAGGSAEPNAEPNVGPAVAPARGAGVAGVRVHSVRLPSYELRTEVVFGLADERLTISHESGFDAAKFVTGTLAAIRSLEGHRGLRRGLDELLDHGLLG